MSPLLAQSGHGDHAQRCPLRASARVALANGNITQAQFVYLMQSISGWEEAQNTGAKATLRDGGDSFSVKAMPDTFFSPFGNGKKRGRLG